MYNDMSIWVLKFYNLITRTPEWNEDCFRHVLYFDMIHSTRQGIGTVRESLIHFYKFLFKDNQVHLFEDLLTREFYTFEVVHFRSSTNDVFQSVWLWKCQSKKVWHSWSRGSKRRLYSQLQRGFYLSSSHWTFPVTFYYFYSIIVFPVNSLKLFVL